MKNIILTLVIVATLAEFPLFSQTAVYASKDFYIHFTGTAVGVDDRGNKVEYFAKMNLRKLGKDLLGSFYSGKEKIFYFISGQYDDASGNIELLQYDPNYFLMGIFKIRFKDEKTAFGSWKDINANKEFALTIHEDFSNSVKFKCHSEVGRYNIDENDKNPYIEVSFNYLEPISYPDSRALSNAKATLEKYIFGPFSYGTTPAERIDSKKKLLYTEYRNIVERQFKMAQKAKALNKEFLYMYNRKNTFKTSVYYNENGILTYSKDSLEEAGGEAMTEGFSYFVIDLKTGNQVKPKDVFYYPNYKDLMADLYVEKIKIWLNAETEEELIQEGFDREFIRYNNNLYVDKYGLGFYFNPYEINERYVKVYFTWEECAQYLKKESPISHLYPKTLVFDEREPIQVEKPEPTEEGTEEGSDELDEYEEFIFLPGGGAKTKEDDGGVVYPDDEEGGVVYPDE